MSGGSRGTQDTADRVLRLLLTRRFNDPIIWVDGGFVTHKRWADPDNAEEGVVEVINE